MPLKEYPVKGKEYSKVRYIIDNSIEPTGVIFGKFSPWTGPRGHGKLLDFANSKFKNVIIVSPTRKVKDDNIDIFTDKQKKEIIKKAVPNVKFYRIPSSIPIRMFTEVIGKGIERPVFIVGEDRESLSKFFKKYEKDNKPITDENAEGFGMGEYLVVPRDKEDTSATLVRQTLINNNKEKFLELTGYKEDMWDYMKGMLKESLDFNKFYFVE